MTAISKYKFELTRKALCCAFLHPQSRSCLEAGPISLKNACIGSLKFFLPIYILQTLYNYKNVNSKYLKKQLKAYFYSTCYGTFFVCSFLTLGCICCQLNLVRYYTLFTVSAFSASAIFLESPENKVLHSLIFFNQVVETFCRILINEVGFSRNRLKESLCFMISTASLSYLLTIRDTKKKFVNFWFCHPNKAKLEGKNEKITECSHKDSCPKYVLKAVCKYFLVGYLFEVAKGVLNIRSLRQIPMTLFRKKYINFALFLCSFIGIFRSSNCLLNKFSHTSYSVNNLIAGFLAGSTYYIRPNFAIMSIAVTTLLQVLLQTKFPSVTEFGHKKKIPLQEIVFCLLSGCLLHARIFHSPSCTVYIKKMISTAINYQCDEQIAFYLDAVRLMFG